MRLKPSRYNHLVEVKGELWGFQGLTCALVRFDTPTWDLLVGTDPSALELTAETSSLVEAGFLVPEEVDELMILRNMAYAARYATHTLELVIAPTLDCNMDCVYCFEAGVEPIAMDDRVVEAVYRLMDAHLGRIRRLKIVWYGGEPLLELERIITMSAALREIVAPTPIHYESLIVTNGTLLSGDVADRLVRHGVSRAQVTIDGTSACHDENRRLRGGGPTWGRIMDNITAASPHLELTIRAALRPDNLNELYDLCAELDRRHLPPTVRVTPAPIHQQHCVAGACHQLSDFRRAVLSHVCSAGFVPGRLDLPYPQNTPGCIATRMPSYLIDPYGDVHHCLEHAGNRKLAAGNLLDGMTSAAQYQRWLQTDPFLSASPTEDCHRCKWLPQCHGGCPNALLRTGRRHCTGMKGNISPWIEFQSMALARLLSPPA